MKNTNLLFPIYIRPREKDSNGFATTLWLNRRDSKIGWYACGAEITSMEEVTVTVHDMDCSVYGGVGNIIHTFQVKVVDMSDEEKEKFRKIIIQKMGEWSEREYKRLREQERIDAIRRICADTFDVNIVDD